MLIYIDEDYLYSIIDELITLDDFVPPSLIPIDKITERNNWLKNNDKQVIMHMNRLYKGEFRTKSEYGEKMKLGSL